MEQAVEFRVLEPINSKICTRETILLAVPTLVVHTVSVRPHIMILDHVSKFVVAMLDGALIT